MKLQLIFLLCLLFLVPQIAFAGDINPEDELIGKFTVKIDDRVFIFIQAAVIENEEIYFPMRSVLKRFGVQIAWNEKDSTAIVSSDEKEYLIDMDLTNLSVSLADESESSLKMIDSRAYIPLSFLKEILDYDFSWDAESQTLNAVRVPGSVSILKNLPEAPQYKVIDTFTGIASWYGGKFHGRKTNNGEIFDENGLTAAHRTLPFNTYLRVTFLKANESTIVRVNDRGPHIDGRILDLSKGAAEEIGLRPHGLGEVKVEVLADYKEEA